MDDNWFELPPSGDFGTPGIYQWWVDGVPIYTGRALNSQRRLNQYIANVRHLMLQDDYRRSNPHGYRRIHHQLVSAIRRSARIEFRVVENCAAEALNERERHHQRQMIATAPFVDLRARFAAEGQIVEAVLARRKPNHDAIRVWARGGAVFWNQDHFQLCWGLHLREAVTQEEIESHGIRLAIQEADDCFRGRFGSIPVRDIHGNEVVAVSVCFLHDELFGFFKDIEQFRVLAGADSWLVAENPDMSDALAQHTDDGLLSLWASSVSD